MQLEDEEIGDEDAEEAEKAEAEEKFRKARGVELARFHFCLQGQGIFWELYFWYFLKMLKQYTGGEL